jgi:hypothetical protein
MDPLSIGLAALNVLGSIFGANTQNEAAKAGVKAAKDEYDTNLGILDIQSRQYDEQVRQQINARVRQAEIQRAKALVAFGEAGVSGNSPLRQLSSLYNDQARDVGITKQNVDNFKVKQNLDKMSLYANMQSKIAAAKAGQVSTAGVVIGAVSAGIGGYTQGQQIKESGGGN